MNNTPANFVNRIKLKIKIKELSEESRIIRREELKQRGKARKFYSKPANANTRSMNAAALYDLNLHRTYDLRTHLRAAHLAYAFLRDKEYASVERPKAGKKIWSLQHDNVGRRLLQNVKTFGGKDEKLLHKELSQWLDRATVTA